jgi:Protein of unknown function (DUF3253)
MTDADADPAELEQVILRLLSERAPEGSICPSDAARAARPGNWRSLMGDVRAAAGRLAAEGRADVIQGGQPVDVARARGPVRIRRHREEQLPRYQRSAADHGRLLAEPDDDGEPG